MSIPGIGKDKDTTQKLIGALREALTVQRNASSSVEGAAAALSTRWSGVASHTYRVALSDWVDGLQKIKLALESIQNNLSTYDHVTSATEERNAQNASWTS